MIPWVVRRRIPGTIVRTAARMTTMTAENIAPPCKHPQVRIVAREEDADYVECQLCGEVFDSNEFRDMMIEETVLEEDEAV